MKNKLFSRHELHIICKVFSKSPVLFQDAIGKIIRITSLNDLFIKRFNPGKDLRAFMVGNEYYRVLFYNPTAGKNKTDSKIYIEALNDNARNKHSRVANWLLLEEFLYEYWNPGGVYAIEGWLLERS